jgi:hypothetical protein
MWLLTVQAGAVDDDAVEPPVPSGLDALTGSQMALVAFLRIDRDLPEVAALVMAEATAPDVAGFVAGWPAAEQEALLVGLLRGDDPSRAPRCCAGCVRRPTPVGALWPRCGSGRRAV